MKDNARDPTMKCSHGRWFPRIKRAVEPLVAGSGSPFPVLIVVALAGCQKSDLVLQSHYRLECAYEELSAGQFLEANALMESLLADVESEKDNFELQRLYAYYLLTRGSVLEAFREAGESTQAARDARRLNPRVMTAMYYAGCAGDALEAAKAAPTVSPSNGRLLPGRLEKIPPETIKEHLNLLVIAFYAALRFNDKMSVSIENFERSGDLTTIESCKEVLDKALVPEEIRPWIELAMSRYIRHENPQVAFAFAIRALHDEQSEIDALTGRELIEWINDGSEFEFKCYKCNLKIIPDRATCYNCGESYLKAYGVKREEFPVNAAN